LNRPASRFLFEPKQDPRTMTDSATSTAPPRLYNELANAQYATLLDRPVSDLAIEMCNTLLRKLLHQQTKKLRPKQKAAFGGLIADLLHRDPSDQGGWLYRAMRVDSFTG